MMREVQGLNGAQFMTKVTPLLESVHLIRAGDDEGAVRVIAERTEVTIEVARQKVIEWKARNMPAHNQNTEGG